MRSNEDNWRRDSDMVFKQISSGRFDDFAMAERAVFAFYVMDLSISRAGISHALKRLEKHYSGGIKYVETKDT